MEARTDLRISARDAAYAQRIAEFRGNPIFQQGLAEILSSDILLRALALCEHHKELPGIPLDSPEIVSVRAASLSRGAALVLDQLYLLAEPIPAPPPETVKEGTYGAEAELAKLPPE